jgi:hypothetical protein
MDDNKGVRRAAIMAGVWAIGVIVAVVLAFAAVAQVASGVAPNHVARMSQQAIDDELAAKTTTTMLRKPGSATTSTLGSSSTTSTVVTGVGGTTTSVAKTSPDTMTSQTAAPTVTTPTTTPSRGSENPPPPITPTTESTVPSAPAHNTVTASQGGTVFTRCSGPETIVYVAAVPKPGYGRTTDVETPQAVRQTFQNGSHVSRIEAECSNGVVHAQVEEESNDE